MKPHWLNSNEYPFLSRTFEVDNQRMHYIDEGKGDCILFVHGTPSWSFDFRKLISELSRTHRCIAIDHIGFGLSDKPKNYHYTTQAHSSNLEKFILDKKLENITLVVHDFGGPIGLNVAIKHPDRFKQFIILNSWLWSSENDPDFKKFSRILRSPMLPFLYRYLNFSARFVLPKSFGKNKISKEVLKHYTKPFRNKNERNGTLGFVHSLLNDQEWFESLWNHKSVIENKRTLFIWGIADQFIKPHYLEKFKTGFKNCEVLKLENCGHFPQEEESENVIRTATKWLGKN
jgi:pimeloyl-ACP methyl ester carboxylesterase